MSVEAKLALQFTCFNPEILAKLETQALFKDMSGKHASAFKLQTAMVIHQFGLSEIAARKVVKHLRPDKNKPPLQAGWSGYFAQLSYETGLGFSVNPDFLSVQEPTVASFAGIFSAVYEVKPEKLYPAMAARLAAMEYLYRNVPAIARIYYQENLVEYYTLLKAAIS